MKIHTIFVEPANYTQDLIYNVHQKLNISFSFLKSNSFAEYNNNILESAQHVFDRNKWYANMPYLWNLSLSNKLIIVNGYSNLPFMILWVFSFVNSCSIGIESDTIYRSTNGLKGVVKKLLLNFIFSNKRVLGLPGGTGLHRKLFANYGMPSSRIFLLPMVVDNNKFTMPLAHELFDKKPTLKFIFVGRLIPLKNLKLLIRSFQTVIKKQENIRLNIIGDGDCRNEIEKLIANTPQLKLLGKKIDFDLFQEYKAANVLILPSFSEQWGLVVNEAMAAGLPVVCSSAVGAAHDLVLKPDTGWVFEDNNEEELTALLLDIVENPEQIKQKAIRAQEFMRNYWNYDLYKASLNQIIDYVKKA